MLPWEKHLAIQVQVSCGQEQMNQPKIITGHCHVTVSLLDGSRATSSPTTIADMSLTIPFSFRWCMFNTKSGLGAVVVGPHAEIDLVAPSHIFIIYLGYV